MRAGTMYRAELMTRIGVRATGDRVLDIGSLDNFWLSRQLARMRVGLDLDVRPRGGCDVMRGDGLNLPFANNAFDSVFAFDVIEHVADDRRFVGELVRVTRPGGTITISTPNADLRIFPAKLTGWAHRRWGHDRCTGYEPSQIEQLFLNAGVQEIRVRELRAFVFLNLYLALSVLTRVWEPLGRIAFRVAAAIDSQVFREGKHGYVLAVARR